MLWTGSADAVPAGWAICDGRVASKSDGSGTVTTPDFRDRVPVGVSPDHAVGTSFGQFSQTFTSAGGGAHSHNATTSSAGAHGHSGSTGSTALTVGQLPSHSHKTVVLSDTGTPIDQTQTSPIAHHGTYGENTEYILTGGSGTQWVGPSEAVGSGQGHVHTISTDGAHTHTVTVDAVIDHSHAVTINTAQPSLAVYFIMKV